MRDIFLANAFTVVADRHPQDLVRIAIRSRDRRDPFARRMDLRAHAQLAAALHGVHRVKEKIEEHLFELVGIGADSIHIGLPGTS